ncbi:MAG: hypothetical protein AAFY76_17070 [Cyanobacteria bacterium J06649_11]
MPAFIPPPPPTEAPSDDEELPFDDLPPPPEGMIDDGPAFVNNTEHIVPDVLVLFLPKHLERCVLYC